MRRFAGLVVLLLAVPALSACGDDEQARREAEMEKKARAMEEELRSKPQKAEDVIRGLTRAVSQLNEKVDTVSGKKLKAMLPEEISGMTRTAYSASKRGIEGFSVSHADATFEEDDGDGQLELSITDIGNISGFAALGLDVLDIEIDEENQDGFQRTGTYKGFKSYQKHQKLRNGSTTEMLVFINERFVARGMARNMEWDFVDEVFDSISIEDLPDLVEDR